MMANIKGKDTKPEMIVRRGLHHLGFRYSLHNKQLPGKPDLVFRQYKAVIFVHGCFWHAHNCRLFKWPKTREEFWKDKITGNKVRDRLHMQKLEYLGWRRLVVWECALKTIQAQKHSDVIGQCANWLAGNEPAGEISGQ
jgi:DNA mismatch endonuclease, patch repair protein